MKGKMPFRLISDYWVGRTFFLKEFLDNRSAKKEMIKDTLIGNSECFIVQIRPPDMENAENQLQRLYISKNDFFLMGQSLRYDYLNKTHYQFLFIQDVEINLARPDKNFSSDKIPKSFYTKRYVPDEIEPLLPAGAPMPPFSLVDWEGKPFYSSETSGKIVVLFFWHMLSPESRNFLKVMEKLHREHEGMGVVFLGMNVKEPDVEGLKKILKRKNITFRQLLNARITAMKFNVNDYPAFYVIGRNGKVIERFYDLKNAESRIALAIKRNLN
jgi:peroxiredoxin